MHKILIVIPEFNIGGAEKIAVYLAAYLDKSKFDVVVLSLHKRLNNSLEDLLNQPNIKIFSTNKSKGFDIRTYFKLDKIIKEFNPDIIHTHQSVMRYVFPFISKKRVLIHTIHSLAKKEIDNPLMRLLQKWSYTKGVIPVSISEEVSRSIYEEYYIKTPHLIPNGIPLSNYLKEKIKDNIKKKLNLGLEDFIFINISGFREAKNHKLLIESFLKVSNEVENSKLVLVGKGPLLEPSKDLINEMGLSNKVTFLGLRDDISDILSASDVFVLSSEWEGYPLCIMEAMASGLPVISTNVGGVPEIVNDNKTGILVPPKNSEELSNAMIYLYKNPNIRKKMGEKAKKIAIEKFSVEKMCRSYEELYFNSLSHR